MDFEERKMKIMKMREEEKVIVDFVRTLERIDQDTYEQIKLVLTCYAISQQDIVVVDFLNTVFDFIEARRPLMICMWGE